MSSLKRKFVKGNTYPVSIGWIIKEKKLRQINDTKCLLSPDMDIPNLPDVKLCIQFQPKRSDIIETGETYAYLHLKMSKNLKISTNVHLTCKSANVSRYWSFRCPKSKRSGYKICNFIDLFDPAKMFIVDQQLIINVSATLTLKNDVEKVAQKVPKIDKSIGFMLWESEADKDVSIFIDNEIELKAHKCVLKRRSSKFAKLLDIKPEPGTTINKIVVRNVSFDAVKEALMHCYDIQGKELLSAGDATNMLIFAAEYEIKDLKGSMEEFCIENMSVSNVCLYANSSVTAKSEKLRKSCLQFLANCMKTGTPIKDIAELNAELKETLFLESFITVYES